MPPADIWQIPINEMAKPTVIVTGISGNLGQRLAPQLSDLKVVGVMSRPHAFSGRSVCSARPGREECAASCCCSCARCNPRR